MRIRNSRTLARGAFTLTEMLIVVAIIVVLAGIGGAILLPRLDSAKEDADRAKANNIAQAAQMYMTNSGDSSTVPTAQMLTAGDGTPNGNPRPLMKHDDTLDRNGHEFQIHQASDGSIVVMSQTPGKDGLPIGNFRKGSQPPQ
jgi:prepilin-type N-terminal cleavage/methylation domain-containing protein